MENVKSTKCVPRVVSGTNIVLQDLALVQNSYRICNLLKSSRRPTTTTVILDRKPLFARYTGQNFEPKVASICSPAGCTQAKI